MFWKRRARRLHKESIEAPPSRRAPNNSNRTGWTIENDQKTLVPSLPNSPQNAEVREQNEMTPGFFAKALDFNEQDTEKTEDRRQGSLEDADDIRSVEIGKTLPPPPRTEAPLPPAPAEQRSYAINVNIDKSMMFDDDISRAVSPATDSGMSRERAPRYRFEEHLPPVTTAPPIAITRRPASSRRSSEYELNRYPQSESLSETESIADDSLYAEPRLQSPREKALSRLQSKAPQILELEIPPPSPSFSFRSYDWYQDIIGDPQIAGSQTPSILSPSPTRTPTQGTFPSSILSSSSLSEINTSLFPEPPSHLHPNTAALPSPTAQSFKLSPNVYRPSSPQPPLPPVPPNPPSPSNPSRVSTLSTMTRKTHNSRSWLPEEGLYLPVEGTIDSFKQFRRQQDATRPTSYSPLN